MRVPCTHQASNAALQRQVMGGAGLAPLGGNGGLAPLAAPEPMSGPSSKSNNHSLLERRGGQGAMTAATAAAAASPRSATASAAAPAGPHSSFPGLRPASAKASSKLGAAAAGALPVSRRSAARRMA
jgi:hypothetical protein